ncbi:UDP-glucose 6-dehydrogenase TuaD [Sporomusaceae bacterium FL31]|nr:UDP-glucose 6-dehydrogenase TuaD [Sporomusaceae bacterium FL31]GCE33896.1 UDP-glucose 6-dehydrogenase TuaD [Sporomusaceae bacterium]
MDICVIGAGYVGLVTGACFAEMGNNVWCVDVDESKIYQLKNAQIPFYEPGLQDIVRKNLKEGRLHFTSQLEEGISKSLFCFIAVGTPPGEDGSADLSHVLNVANSIGRYMEGYQIIVNKSTVPVGTSEKVRRVISQELHSRGLYSTEFDVVSNPEFLKEGAAIEDFMKPDRIIIGTDNVRTAELMKQLYEPFVRNQHPVYIMDIKSAEISKYAANAMLATRISFMNEIAQLCDRVGGDVANVRLGIGSDKRIGMSFLYAGTGYGGSCFPKDIKALIQIGNACGVNMKIISAVDGVNEQQKLYIIDLICQKFGDNLQGMLFGIWGLAFKPQTDDMREAPSIVIIEELIKRGARLIAYDPEAIEQAKKVLKKYNKVDSINYVKHMVDATEGVDGLILITEWRQFRQPDFKEIKSRMKRPIIFDGRNQYDQVQMKRLGFEYYCVGRNSHET